MCVFNLCSLARFQCDSFALVIWYLLSFWNSLMETLLLSISTHWTHSGFDDILRKNRCKLYAEVANWWTMQLTSTVLRFCEYGILFATHQSLFPFSIVRENVWISALISGAYFNSLFPCTWCLIKYHVWNFYSEFLFRNRFQVNVILFILLCMSHFSPNCVCMRAFNTTVNFPRDTVDLAFGNRDARPIHRSSLIVSMPLSIYIFISLSHTQTHTNTHTTINIWTPENLKSLQKMNTKWRLLKLFTLLFECKFSTLFVFSRALRHPNTSLLRMLAIISLECRNHNNYSIR